MRKYKRTNSFLKQKSYLLAAGLMLMAVFGMTGVYVSEQNAQQKQQEQLALAQQEEQERLAAQQEEQELLAAQELEENVSEVDKVIEPNDDFLDEPGAIVVKDEAMAELEPQDTEEEPKQDVAQETAASQVQQELHFDAANEMQWPLQGNVIMNYSMEQTIYFSTLDQYKYNPALVIQGNVNDKVFSVADGKITSIETNAETGCTVTVELGDGYHALYGQLKEVPFQVNDYVAAGDIIGYVSEPTKYYSLEGPNLYFQMVKDGESVDPMEFLQ